MKVNKENISHSIEKGDNLLNKSNTYEAQKYYKHAIELGCNSNKVFMKYGTCLLQENKIEESIVFNLKELEIEPNDLNANFNLGLAYYKIHNFEKAQIYAEKANDIQKKIIIARISIYFHHLFIKYFFYVVVCQEFVVIECCCND